MEGFRLTRNLGLKILSLVFAAALWFLVTNLSDPVASITLNNIPVQLQNVSAITSRGEIYEVLEGTDTINAVTVYAPRSIVDTLNASNIIATADLSELSSLDTASIDLTTNKYADRIESISGTIDTVKLNIEDRKSKILRIDATASGEAPDGYLVDTITTEQNQLRISGPASAIDAVEAAVVDVDVTGFTADIGTDATIRLLDEEGEEIDRASITKNISSVRVNITILQTKWMHLNVTPFGTPQEGYTLTGQMDVTPESVLVAGRASVLNGINGLDVSDASLNVNGLRENLTTSLNIRSFLPAGTRFGDEDFNGNVNVVVYIAQEEETTPATAGEDATSEEGTDSTPEAETEGGNGA